MSQKPRFGFHNISGARLEPVRDFLFSVCLAAFPLFFLSIKGWTNVFLFLLVLLSAAYWRELKEIFRGKRLDRPAWAVILTLASGTAAILAAQAIRGEPSPRDLDGPSRMLLAIPVFLVVLQRRIDFVRAFQYVCPISLLIAALVVTFWPAARIDGRYATNFVDPITFGNYALVLGFMSFLSIDILSRDRPVIRALKLCGLVMGIFLSIWSQSRSGWLAVPFLVVFWLFAYRGSLSTAARAAFVGASLGIVAATYYFLDLFRDRIDSAVESLLSWWTGANPDTAVGYRLTLWRIALVLFSKRPLAGWGDQGYIPALQTDPDIAALATPLARRVMYVGPHNEILAGMVQAGVFGLLYKLILFVVPLAIFLKAVRSDSTHAHAAGMLGAGLVIGLFICGFFGEQVFYLKFQSSFYGLMIASLCGVALWDSGQRGAGGRPIAAS